MENREQYDESMDFKFVFLKDDLIHLRCDDTKLATVRCDVENQLCEVKQPSKIHRLFYPTFSKDLYSAYFKFSGSSDIIEAIEIPKVLMPIIKSIQISASHVHPDDIEETKLLISESRPVSNIRSPIWVPFFHQTKEDLKDNNIVRIFGEGFAMAKCLGPFRQYSLKIEFNNWMIGFSPRCLAFMTHEIAIPIDVYYQMQKYNLVDHTNPKTLKIAIENL
jgi:hypothetical protein